MKGKMFDGKIGGWKFLLKFEKTLFEPKPVFTFDSKDITLIYIVN